MCRNLGTTPPTGRLLVVDEVFPAAWEMLRCAGGMESVRLHGRLRSVRDAFARRSGEPEIRDFIEQADAQLILQL